MVKTDAVSIIDVPTLARRLAAADPPTVIDVRWRLGQPSARSAYRDGHVPGATFLDLDADVCGQPGPGGRHPLPEPDRLEEALRRAGVRHDHPVVVYDHGDGQPASRLWWTLRWAGHPDVAVLDGGYGAWVEAGRPVEPGDAEPPYGDIVVRPGQLPVADAAGAARLAEEGVLLDARVPERYRGEVEPIDPVPGRVPGAVNLPVAGLADPDGRLLPPERLRETFEAAGVRADRPVGAYCGSGVTAARTVFALHEAGFDHAVLYVGSWSEWITDPARLVAMGDQA
jgi:thiosulfate/3-mercaptopyruvate sulfurtransferase